ncbi:hypothetical protein ATK36_4849 [Amycolatopsis sulphurea]|jgi:hypothetical protein|uniref:Uncharacterized protein n=1 Tax=Amycolatopsis sulphurea TaxID=76022 RepID=A0A2A9FDZ9_9PSEU|nr:hypothetical protein ATK36_4849 [Amycolatopsis sulphurea]
MQRVDKLNKLRHSGDYVSGADEALWWALCW